MAHMDNMRITEIIVMADSPVDVAMMAVTDAIQIVSIATGLPVRMLCEQIAASARAVWDTDEVASIHGPRSAQRQQAIEADADTAVGMTDADINAMLTALGLFPNANEFPEAEA